MTWPCTIDLLKQSFDAFTATIQPALDRVRTAAIFNGEIVSDSESDNADDYAELITET